MINGLCFCYIFIANSENDIYTNMLLLYYVNTENFSFTNVFLEGFFYFLFVCLSVCVFSFVFNFWQRML